ncbi:MAG: DUF2892 domain-containing protein [Candidatus Anstonellaceae archaeon]
MLKIENNISQTERIIRGVLAVLFLVGFFYLSQPLNYLSVVLAIIMGITSALSYCPIYQLIKKK